MSGMNLIVEIGTEEIPASYLSPALEALQQRLADCLINAPEGHDRIQIWGTPNRLALGAWGLIPKEEDRTEEVTGPPVNKAYDSDGKPTKAAMGFAKGQGIEVSDLTANAGGDRVLARKRVKGRTAKAILTKALPEIILGLPFPKSMRWGEGEVTFVRPIHWVLAVLDGEILDFSIGKIKTSNFSRGHRFLSPEKIKINSPDDYEDKLKQAFVFASLDSRRNMVESEIIRVMEEAPEDLRLLSDDELLWEVTNLVEFPVAVCGRFDPSYLELPAQVCVTAMREHQRYFSLTDEAGNLKPYFVAINNIQARDMDLVKQGHERVLKARLDDARFHFTEDRKHTLESRREELKKVVFHTLLGTSWEKVDRTVKLSGYLAELLDPGVKDHLIRAAELSKCDLVTGLVIEFPSLQGSMGRIYAELDGEPPEVAAAISEHYLPARAGGELPSSPIGAMLSLAEKVESIVGCFSVGLIPTGAADPYALRRQALGVINIILERKYRVSLGDLIEQALSNLDKWRKRDEDEIKKDVIEFFRLRLKNQLTGLGASTDGTEAVLSLYHDDLVAAAARVWALEEIKAAPDFDDLAIAFKRVVNIIKKFGAGSRLNPDRFTTDEEKSLYQAYKQVSIAAEELIRVHDFSGLINKIVTLKPDVDRFFDEVLVDDPDQELKSNRLALLSEVSGLFELIADFSKIST
jgi:glycyl-tRNA synthetase beta chain